MSAEEILLDAEERMEKTISSLKKQLSGIRTGRANPGLVDSLRVEVYGSQMPLKQLAAVAAPEPTQIAIRPFDPNTIKDIEKAILASDLGFNPQNDGRIIRLNVPALSSEVRKRMAGRIKELSEDAKISLRNIRRDANKQADKEEKDKILSEDERDDVKDQVQELIKKYEEQATEAAAVKEKEVMED